LWPSDIDLVHRLWQELSDKPGIDGRLHHRDVVGVALRRLDEELHSRRAGEVLADIESELNRPKEKPAGPVAGANGGKAGQESMRNAAAAQDQQHT
jgi:hypothetical protein